MQFWLGGGGDEEVRMSPSVYCLRIANRESVHVDG